MRSTATLCYQKNTDFSWSETVQCLTKIFGERSSLFHTRYQYFQIVKDQNDDFVTYAGLVNRECERFKLKELTENQFKGLIFVCGLQSSKDSDIRTRILAKIESDPGIFLQLLTEECQRLINLKHDTQLIEKHGDHSSVDVIQRKSFRKPKSTTSSRSSGCDKPKSACWNCGEWHYVKFCPFINRKCYKCGKKGHKQTRCRFHNVQSNIPVFKLKSNVVYLNKTYKSEGRRKFISILINDVPVRMQLDTVSDITIISCDTWKVG